MGPVYKTRWSPFNDQIFLTCSADWTIKLWKDDIPDKPIVTLESLNVTFLCVQIINIIRI